MEGNGSRTAPYMQEEIFSSIAGNGSPFTDEVLHQMELRNWPPRDVFGVNMAAVEAITNAMMHGNEYDPEKMVHVAVQISDDIVHLEVRDEGPGFDITSIPDPRDEANMDNPSGRGILLIHAFMTKVWFNESGNMIYMEKVRSEDI